MEKRKFYTNLTIASSPHAVTGEDTQRLMLTVMLALVPALGVSVYVFGFRTLLVTAFCIVASVFFEYLYNAITKQRQTVTDGSAALTGMLIAMNVPANLPLWIAAVGCFFAIFIIKGLYGGIGCNLFNPAITARVFMIVAFGTQMTTWPTPRAGGASTIDAATTATPLGLLKEGGADAVNVSNMDLFLGFCGGSLGEVSALALLIGGLFLIWRKVISPVTPLCFIATVAVIALIAGQDPIFHILSGGVFLGAFFMATDYVTTPYLTKGKVIFGIGCGIMTMLIRLFGNYPEGVSFAILFMNVLTPHIDNFCINSLYKVPKPKKEKKGGDGDEK